MSSLFVLSSLDQSLKRDSQADNSISDRSLPLNSTVIVLAVSSSFKISSESDFLTSGCPFDTLEKVVNSITGTMGTFAILALKGIPF